MIIVTGGAGFIGSALIWRLNKEGIDDIIVVDNLSTSAKWKNLNPLKFADYMEKGDFLEAILKNKFGKEIECIFHLGACTSTLERNMSYLIKNNFEYSKILCEWAIKNGVRFIYASSAATYGTGEEGFSDDEKNLYKLRPLNPYAFSKHIFDLWAYRKGYLKEIVGLKYFNVYGPNEYHKGEMRSVVLKGYEQIKKYGFIRLFKSYKPEYKHGEQKRDFIYVKDAVEVTLFFYKNGRLSGIYNVGTGKAREWNALAVSIFNALGKKPRIKYIEMPEDLRDKYQYFTQADITKLRKAGYKKDFIELEMGVDDYVKNYLEKGYKTLEI